MPFLASATTFLLVATDRAGSFGLDETGAGMFSTGLAAAAATLRGTVLAAVAAADRATSLTRLARS